MAVAAMTETSFSSTPPTAGDSSFSSPALPPPTTPAPSRRSNLPRPMSHASKNRLSQYSAGSGPSRSRSQSHSFPAYLSSLPHTVVRDFAYPVAHPLHYGPPPEPSGPSLGLTTPASEHRRMSDPPASWDQRIPSESWTAEALSRGDILPIHFGDGPPYSEDDDLQSPVVATRHRKHKSTSGSYGTARPRTADQINAHRSSALGTSNYDNERAFFVSKGGDGSERYYVSQGGEANGPGGELVTYMPGRSRQSQLLGFAHKAQQAEEKKGYVSGDSSCPSSPGCSGEDQSRYSRDYQFTITSPDEAFHGKAVALFDFKRENENELPLIEGQIIWVSYRHGQGWLVAEDPKTQESGLVPEAYVRLLRDIEGDMNSLTSQVGDVPVSPLEAGTPTQAEHSSHDNQTSGQTTNGYHQPVVSVFSTSNKDLNPYPTEQLGIQAGQTPQVIHYHGQRGGSQANTPTISQHYETGISQDLGKKTVADEPRPPEPSPTSATDAVEAEKECMEMDR